MTALGALYQGVMLDHYRRPRNHGALDGDSRHAERTGTLCGDRVTVYLRVENGVIVEAAFEGRGCAVAIASSSLMTDAVRGQQVARIRDLVEGVDRMLHERAASPESGEIAALAAVRDFPARVECALLAWHALSDALHRVAAHGRAHGEGNLESGSNLPHNPMDYREKPVAVGGRVEGGRATVSFG